MLQTQAKLLSGTQILINTLQKNSVDSIFGYPGGVVLDVYDGLSKQNIIKHYLVRHEQSAVHAAEGYAGMSGKTGVVLVTSGPGATNILTGVADAYFDGIPLVVITGQVDKNLLGKNAFQEINIIEITKSCTKAGFQVTDVNNLEETLNKAFELSQKGKKGPVIVDITRNVFSEFAQYKNQSLPQHSYETIDSLQELDNAELLISQSKRPIILAGAGVLNSGAQKELFDFAKFINAPVVSTMMGLGAYPLEDENYFGMPGIYGHNSANEVLRRSDLIILLGARFNDRISSVFNAEDLNKNILQVDINPEELGRNIAINTGICSDIKVFLQHLKVSAKDRAWLDSVLFFKSLNTVMERHSNLLHSVDVINEIYKYADTVTTEVGQHQIFAVQNYKPNIKLITSGGFGTMGFGLPAAIGAAVASPDKPIVCLAGDGSIQMNIQELATIKDYNLPVKIVIFNNGYLGMVRQLQENNFSGNYYETKISNPDFVTLAHSYGISAARAHNKAELHSVLKMAFADNEPFVAEIVIEPFELV